MCGIIGVVGNPDETLEVLLTGLVNLDYRGYDSAGVAIANKSLTVRKREGKLDALRELLDAEDGLVGPVGLGHTRWSTHGAPTDANAHPHTDCTGEVAVVHNGIIENYQALRDELSAKGHEFRSETDTEVVPHLIEVGLEDGMEFEAAFRAAVDRLEGSFALAATMAGSDTMLVARRDSPLVLGIGDDATYVASDVPAFLEYTDQVVYLADGQVARIDSDGWTVTDRRGDEEEVAVETVAWDPEETGKGGYAHYMLKEIHEQPRAIRQCLQGRVDELAGEITLEELDALGPVDRVQLVACGTSYHAAMYAAALFREQGIVADAYLASEYAGSPPPMDSGTLVIGVTQSGETADTLSAVRVASRSAATTLAVTNVVGSSVTRECDHSVLIRAGPEIGVAATKTFSSQVVALNLLVERIVDGRSGVRRDRESLIAALRDLPGQVQEVLDESAAHEVAEACVDADAYFFIGRGLDHAVALEGALKLKEITYKHAEGFAAGELKHGPLALVTADTPVFATVTGKDERARKTIANAKEVEARGAPVVVVTDGVSEVERYADAVLEIPEAHPRVAPVLANVQYQLVAYHTAALLDRSIDKPRNLAKSVTVE